ncbi:MAG: aminotransferase class V-fold PLP-dependent enzyme [Chloroflexota bacterium]|nr:aminotransferase class V-fold PLP-dependent enzyme [Chloroflexota bacterium]
MKLPGQLPIYLDHHSTTPVDPRVAAVVMEVMTYAYGNANSVEHLYGELAAELLYGARCDVARLVGAAPEGVCFTSGSTQGISLALFHAVASCKHRPLRVALSTVEHRAVMDAIKLYEQQGEVVVCWLPVDGQARLEMSELRRACQDGVDLVCVMAANNEVGTIYPVGEIVAVANAAGSQTLVDATQAVGRIPMVSDEWGITYLAVSAHKIYGPKGVGALIAPRGFEGWLMDQSGHSAAQGTPNVPGIVGLGKACRLRQVEMSSDEPRMANQRDRLEEMLLDGIDGLVVNGDRSHRLSNNLHVSVPGVPNDAVIARLRRLVALSSGAACSSASQSPSHVLRAMGLSETLQEGALRIGTGKFTTNKQIELAGRFIVDAVSDTRTALRG